MCPCTSVSRSVWTHILKNINKWSLSLSLSLWRSVPWRSIGKDRVCEDRLWRSRLVVVWVICWPLGFGGPWVCILIVSIQFWWWWSNCALWVSMGWSDYSWWVLFVVVVGVFASGGCGYLAEFGSICFELCFVL